MVRRDMFGNDWYGSGPPPPPPSPPRATLEDRIARRTSDGRNQLRRLFLNSMRLGLRARTLPRDILELIWVNWLRDRHIPFFPLYYNRRS